MRAREIYLVLNGASGGEELARGGMHGGRVCILDPSAHAIDGVLMSLLTRHGMPCKFPLA